MKSNLKFVEPRRISKQVSRVGNVTAGVGKRGVDPPRFSAGSWGSSHRKQMSSPSAAGMRHRKPAAANAGGPDTAGKGTPPTERASGFHPRDGAPEQSGERVAGILVSAAVFTVYVRTMYPHVPGGDSGELIVAGCTTGIAHPPGYPLFTMLAVLFHALPIGGSPAWRINLLSVVLSTACAWFNFKTVVRWDAWLRQGGPAAEVPAGTEWGWSTSVWAGVLSSMMLAFCPLMWMYSIQVGPAS